MKWFLDKSNTALVQEPPDHVVLQEVLGADNQVNSLVPVAPRLVPHLDPLPALQHLDKHCLAEPGSWKDWDGLF